MRSRESAMATVANTEPFSIRDEIYIPALRTWLGSGRSRLGFVVMGEAGQGKSSLINGLLGKEVAAEGDDLDSMTQKVEKFSYVENGINVTLWDTPGFGMESDEKEEQILRDMDRECNPVDLMLYCIRLDQARWPKKNDIVTIRKVTRVFGPRVWQHCQFVLTFANQIAGLCPAGKDVVQYFSERVWRFEEKIRKTLKEHAKLSEEEIEQIRAVPVGDPHQSGTKTGWDLPDREDWFLDFWFECTYRMNQSALPTLLRLNKHRVTEDLDIMNPPDDSINPPERLYVRPVPDVVVSEEANGPHTALESPCVTIDEIPSSAEASPMPSITGDSGSGNITPQEQSSLATTTQPLPCEKQPDPTDTLDADDDSLNPEANADEPHLALERIGVSICKENVKTAEESSVSALSHQGTADNVSPEQPNPAAPNQPLPEQEDQRAPHLGLHNRPIPLFRILQRHLKDRKAGFNEYINMFVMERGKQVRVVGHVGGFVEGFVDWIRHKIAND